MTVHIFLSPFIHDGLYLAVASVPPVRLPCVFVENLLPRLLCSQVASLRELEGVSIEKGPAFRVRQRRVDISHFAVVLVPPGHGGSARQIYFVE